jgi:hypothetical protein
MASAAIKWGLAAVVVLGAAVGGELAYLHHRNVVDQTAPETPIAKSDPDNLVFVKHEHPMTFKDEKDLKGRTLWISAGDQMVYYPYAGHIDFAHPQGMLMGAEKIEAKDAIEEKAKPDPQNRIPLGDKQVFVIFTKSDGPKEYAVPVGFKQGGDYTFSADDIFYYEDPHKLFNYWSPAVWQAIDAHKAIVGMSERQVQTALGQTVNYPADSKIGDRTVTFNNYGHPIDVTFVGDKATTVGTPKS